MSVDQGNHGELHAKAAELVETARAQWAEHHRVRPLCHRAYDEAHRLEAEMTNALAAARKAEADLSRLLQGAAIEAEREKPQIEHPETARPELTGLLGDAFQRGQQGYQPKSNDEGK